MQNHINELGMFAKFWEPGKVKTRLASSVGNENASTIYHGMVVNLLQKLNGCGDQRSIVFAPTPAESDFSNLISERSLSWNVEPQSSGALGERMDRFFESKLNSSPARVVLVGSDCLDIDPGTLENAFAYLNECQVVLGPSFDGGYYLIGMSAYRPEIFRDISWSTESVLEQTIQRLKEHDISYKLLEQKHDIDHLADLVQLQERLEAKLDSDDSAQEARQFDADLLDVIKSSLSQS